MIKLQSWAMATPAMKFGVLSKANMTATNTKLQMMKMTVAIIQMKINILISFLTPTMRRRLTSAYLENMSFPDLHTGPKSPFLR